jgi:hypothetical protein
MKNKLFTLTSSVALSLFLCGLALCGCTTMEGGVLFSGEKLIASLQPK